MRIFKRVGIICRRKIFGNIFIVIYIYKEKLKMFPFSAGPYYLDQARILFVYVEKKRVATSDVKSIFRKFSPAGQK